MKNRGCRKARLNKRDPDTAVPVDQSDGDMGKYFSPTRQSRSKEEDTSMDSEKRRHFG